MESKRIESFGIEVAAAYKIIAEYKWNEEFLCIRCNSVDYFEGKYPYSRRCLKCKKDFSPTEGTVFHGVRFPLLIAIYITWITAVKPDKITSEKLLEYIEVKFKTSLRQKTVWAFLIKVYSGMTPVIPAFDEKVTVIRFRHVDRVIVAIKGFSNFNERVVAFLEEESHTLKDLIERYKAEEILVGAFDVTYTNASKKGELNVDVKPMDNVINTSSSSGVDSFALQVLKVITGVSPVYFQAYLNFYCFKAGNYNHDDLMRMLINPKSK